MSRPSVIIARGRKCLVGTNHGNLYILTRDGVSMKVDKLQKSHNVIFGEFVCLFVMMNREISIDLDITYLLMFYITFVAISCYNLE